MIFDRPYMRTGTSSQEKPWALKYVLIATLSIFVLQNIFEVWFHSEFLIKSFSLTPFLIEKGFLWTLLTYAFLHASTLHLIFNLVGIFFIGRIVEPRLGSTQFLALYLGSALCGSLLWLAVNWSQNSSLVGASAAVLGIIAYFCLVYWEQPITFLLFFVIPITIKPKWIFWILLATECFLFLFHEIPEETNHKIANSAHLGGMLMGILYYKWLTREFNPHFSRKIQSKIKNWFQRQTSPYTKNRNFSVNIQSHDELKTEVDRILDKINTKGFKALEQKEIRTLERARRLLKS